jgi:PAS domain S-box-containing protein
LSADSKTVWEVLWDYDPNGLVVFDRERTIQIVNPAFCEMFHTTRDQLIGAQVEAYLEDMDDVELAWDSDQTIRRERHYARHDLYVKKVLFAVAPHHLMACIMVDITQEWKQKQELLRLKQETLRNVDLVVDKQMKVAQEIAGLLGETTAQTKVNLLRLSELLKKGEL